MNLLQTAEYDSSSWVRLLLVLQGTNVLQGSFSGIAGYDFITEFNSAAGYDYSRVRVRLQYLHIAGYDY